MNEEIKQLVLEKARRAIEMREEILTAFIAKYGFEPDEMILFEQPSTGKFWVEKKSMRKEIDNLTMMLMRLCERANSLDIEYYGIQDDIQEWYNKRKINV